MNTTRRLRLGLISAAAVAALLATLPLRASESIDYDALNKIKQEGLGATNSKVMEISSYLTDVYGPRLTGSPNIRKAAEWVVGKLQEWGLARTALEPWAPDGNNNNNGFPRGWSNDKFYMAAVSPQSFPIPGTPTAWTPGTAGLVQGMVVLAPETTLEALKEKHPAASLKGKWVMRVAVPSVAAIWSPPAQRYSKDQLDKLENPSHAEFGVTPPGGRQGGGPGLQVGASAVPSQGTPCTPGRGSPGPSPCDEYLRGEGILGTISTAAKGHGVYTIGGASRTADPATMWPQVTIGAEQYGRIARLLEMSLPVTIEADVKNTYYPNPPMFNIVGEIPGTDKADELVMLGAHFDSWHASTGATDNAAGSAAMLEAMRILKQTGVRLRRTVRIGLWTGEEQGLLGSRNYVTQHFGSAGRRGGGRGAQADGNQTAAAAAPARLPDHAKFAAYFNIDNGTGAIRGVYLQGNQAVAPIFREWMEPFHTLGMTSLTLDDTRGTDHLSFDGVNLPGFQFIQDDIEYETLTHHTNLDSYERLQPEDMRRNATIAAAFAFLAANRDEMLPRKPPTSPFVGGRGR